MSIACLTCRLRSSPTVEAMSSSQLWFVISPNTSKQLYPAPFRNAIVSSSDSSVSPSILTEGQSSSGMGFVRESFSQQPYAILY